jgi:hypothetical protein
MLRPFRWPAPTYTGAKPPPPPPWVPKSPKPPKKPDRSGK